MANSFCAISEPKAPGSRRKRQFPTMVPGTFMRAWAPRPNKSWTGATAKRDWVAQTPASKPKTGSADSYCAEKSSARLHSSAPAAAPAGVSPLPGKNPSSQPRSCLLYTSDAADDLLCVDLGG